MRPRKEFTAVAPLQNGIALVLVLWVISLLAVIAGSFAFSMRTNTQLAGNRVAQARAQTLADAGIHRGLYELYRARADGERWKANGAQHAFDLEGGHVTVTMVSESAFIDLNTAAEPLLKGLLISAGLDDEGAARLLDAIVDWRDADELPRTQGAERDQYQAAGLKYLPTNKPFVDVEELRMVLGMTAELFASIAPALTVHSRQTGINSILAPKAVLMALPGATEQDVDAYLAQRADLLENGLEPSSFPPAAGFSVVKEGQVYNLRSKALSPDGGACTREAVVKLTNEPKRPFVFFRWRAG
jgi:general secretion pathway protein K